jgi:hypothetical protein
LDEKPICFWLESNHITGIPARPRHLLTPSPVVIYFPKTNAIGLSDFVIRLSNLLNFTSNIPHVIFTKSLYKIKKEFI